MSKGWTFEPEVEYVILQNKTVFNDFHYLDKDI
jgi:hypothetical protein